MSVVPFSPLARDHESLGRAGRGMTEAFPGADTTWRRRLLGDLWLFLAVFAVGLVVAVLAALV